MTTMAITIWSVVASLVVLVLWAVRTVRQRDRQIAVVTAQTQFVRLEPGPEYEHFGHPRPPLIVLRQELPKPPPDHGWETWVAYKETTGEPMLHLTLMNLTSSQVVDSTSKSLTRDLRNSVWPTYAEAYRNYTTHGGQVQILQQNLIGPLTDWAQEQVYKFSGKAGDVEGYGITS